MKRKQLLVVCEQLIQSFNPDKVTVDAHADEQLQQYDATDRLFLQQVFYGSYRYRDLLKPMLTHFLTTNASRVSRNDYTKFMIIGYLAMFRLEELGITAFASLVTALDPASMHVFLSYLFDRTNLLGTIKTAWVRVLDETFVETSIIHPMLQCEAEIASLLTQLHTRAFGQQTAASSSSSEPQQPDSSRGASASIDRTKKALTVPVAPKLTQPRPRRAVEPIRIAQEIKATPVPANLNALTLADLAQQQAERKQKTQEETTKKYADAASALFTFESTAKSNLERVRLEVEAARNAELQFEFKATPAPDVSKQTQAHEVKLNTAAILREDALYKKKQAKDAQLLRAYETELRDPMEFYRWQSTMQQQDDATRLAEVETRRLEMVQAQFDAVEAAHRARMENRDVALQMKRVARDLEAQRLADDAELDERQRSQMLELKHVRETAPRDAESRVKDDKVRQRDELQAFLAAERERKAAQDAIDQAQREELIRQIRALDCVPRERVAVFDPTSTAQLGLLDEMSLAELHERLQVRKREQLAWEAARRDDIVTDKLEKDAQLLDKVANLSRLRSAAASANATHRRTKQAADAAKKQLVDAMRRDGNVKLAQKLTEQRRVREAQTAKLQLEADALAKKRLFLGAAKNVLEEHHFDELSRGAEREARGRQTQFQAAATAVEHVRAHEQTMRSQRAFHDKQQQQCDDATRSHALERMTRANHVKERDEDDTLRAIVRHEQQRYQHAKDVLQSRNMYATNQSAALVAHARSLRTIKPVKSVASASGAAGGGGGLGGALVRPGSRSRNQVEGR